MRLQEEKARAEAEKKTEEANSEVKTEEAIAKPTVTDANFSDEDKKD
jgi:hypothetical protein